MKRLVELEEQIEIVRAELNQAEKDFDHVTNDLLNKSAILDELIVEYQKLKQKIKVQVYLS